MSSKTLKQGDQVTFGAKYRHILHGISGIATAQCRYLSGCDHVELQWTKDGEVKADWFDILVLESVPTKKKPRVLPPKRQGGPQAHPGSRGPA